MPQLPLPLTIRWAAMLLFAGTLCGAAEPAVPLERLPLFTPAELKSWSTAESTVAVSTAHTRDATASLQWHVTVDYQTGEPKYPIGWPRVNRSLPVGAIRDWSAWDYLQCWVYVATNRDQLPALPAGLGLHTPDRANAFQRPLPELRAREWVQIRVPITQIPRAHDVRQIQFHIAESNYRDGDSLDFHISDLALVRHASPTLLDFAPDSAVLFSDARRLPLSLQLAGVPAGATTEVILELHAGTHPVLRTTARAARGGQSFALELPRGPLAAGDYEVRATLTGTASPRSARIRVVDSPWR